MNITRRLSKLFQLLKMYVDIESRLLSSISYPLGGIRDRFVGKELKRRKVKKWGKFKENKKLEKKYQG